MDDFSELVKQTLPYVHTAFLAIFGGTVQYFRQVREATKKFRWSEFLGDILASSFAGLLTFYLCLIAEIDGYHASVLIAISGHMGTRAIDSIEAFYNRFVGKL